MKARFNYFEPNSIVAVVVAMVVLTVGVFIFFTIIQTITPEITQNYTEYNGNTNSSFNMSNFFESYQPIVNILPIILIFAGITGIIGFTCRIASRYEPSSDSGEFEDEEPEEVEEDKEESPRYEDVKEMILHKQKLAKPTDLKTKLALRKQQLKDQQKQIEESKKSK